MTLDSFTFAASNTGFQAALMIFVLDTTIGLGVWLPFTVGKTTALLSVSFRSMNLFTSAN